jgi:hypothetical protein
MESTDMQNIGRRCWWKGIKIIVDINTAKEVRSRSWKIAGKGNGSEESKKSGQSEGDWKRRRSGLGKTSEERSPSSTS